MCCRVSGCCKFWYGLSNVLIAITVIVYFAGEAKNYEAAGWGGATAIWALFYSLFAKWYLVPEDKRHAELREGLLDTSRQRLGIHFVQIVRRPSRIIRQTHFFVCAYS